MWKRTENRIGEEFRTNKGYLVKIIKYDPKTKCTVEFEDGTILSNITYQNLQKGEVRHPNQPTIHKVGYVGIGPYVSEREGKSNRAYTTWLHMLQRCYDSNYQKNHPTYISCSVDKEWHNFQNFAKWFEENYIENFHLDKDILVQGNRIYGPNTCCFVPQEINNLFKCTKQNIQKRKNKYRVVIGIGQYDSIEEAKEVYHKARKEHIKTVAKKYKKFLPAYIYNTLITNTNN